MSGKSVCPVCKFPERDMSLGTITHWMLSCTCGQEKASQAQEIQVSLCRACGKRIGKGRDGSITQYVFFHDACACENPVAYKSSISLPKEELVKYYYETDSEEDEAELDLRGDRFPTDRFKPVAELGRGASGIVWLARDKFLKKRVAVKVLQNTDAKSLTAFQDEARAISALKHPGIVEIVDFGLVDAAIPYMVLEYVPGVSLCHILRRDQTIGWRKAVCIAVQVCDSLTYAHDKGIFHRDITPGNILVVEPDDADPFVKLIDFGIAKFCAIATGNNTLAGSPLYMSPDTVLGKGYTALSEVYSLGCVIFEMLSGQPPYFADTAIHVLSMHATSEIPLLASNTFVPPGLNAIVQKALAKEPDSRFQSAEEFRSALVSVLECSQFSLPSEPLMIEEETVKQPHNNWLIVFLSAILVMIGISALQYLWSGNSDSTRLKTKGGTEHATSLSVKPVVQGELRARVDIGLEDVEDELRNRGAIGKKFEVDGNILRSLDADDDDFKYIRFIGRTGVSPNAPDSRGTRSGEQPIFEAPQRITTLEISMSSNVRGTGLKYLLDHDFSKIDADSAQFGDEGASLIPRFKRLRAAGVSRSFRLTEKGLSDIVRTPGLVAIQLRWINLPPNACKIISTSKTITSVNLGHSNGLTLNDFKYLTSNPKIHTVRVAATKIGDKWVDEFTRMKLTELDINENDITDDGLQKLTQIKTLQKIKLSIGQGITERGVVLFSRKLPTCQVLEN